MNYARRTLKNTTTLQGKGLHTGEPVTVRIHPAQDGIHFRHGSERVAAKPENVTDTTRCTRLGSIGMIEHMMAALGALEITDAEVEMDAAELPGADGSSDPYLRALLAAGTEDFGEAEVPQLFTRIFHQEDDSLKLAIGKGSGHWRYVYNLGPRWPHEQAYETSDVCSAFADEIAAARTFVLAEEIPMAQQMGLGRGLDESSVLILGVEGYINAPRFPDEPARHKLLDLMGDLYLAGVPLRSLNVVAERTGHRCNVHAAAMLYEAINRAESSGP
jgi:UDP-3-O-[3-hydroxymyristoyl] N-acetylglucosamine deacetylase